MQLPLLEAPARGGGCIDRGYQTVELGEGLGSVEVIVSGCQQRKFRAGISGKVTELRERRLPREEMQREIQSWIDGGSPCDMKYAKPGDQVPFWQAMQDEERHHGEGGAEGLAEPGEPDSMGQEMPAPLLLDLFLLSLALRSRGDRDPEGIIFIRLR